MSDGTVDSAPDGTVEIDVIILDLDGGEMLADCLRSLAGQTLTPRNVIVWDNGSSSPVADRSFPDYPFRLIIRRSETNLGFTGGVNGAMGEVTAPFVALVNNDVTLAPNWLQSLHSLLETDPKMGSAQTVILGRDGMIDGAGIDIGDGTFRQLAHGTEWGSDELPREVWGVSGTAALFRTDALREVETDGGILHPRFFAYYEDVELAARLQRNGWRSGLVSSAEAVHQGSVTGDRLGRAGEFLKVRNRYYVNRLHPGVGARSALLGEDVRRTFRLLLAGRWSSTSTLVRAVVEGLRSDLRETGGD